MGQTIEINGSRRLGDHLIIDTDRSLAGQDGEAYGRGEPSAAPTFPEQLARSVFRVDPRIARVHVMSNAVTVTRPEGWTDELAAAVEQKVSSFFRFYD